MKIFIDTEFIEYPNTIEFISIGLVREDNYEYYAISEEFNPGNASHWVFENVIERLEEHIKRKSIKQIAKEIIDFCDVKPEFWGYYADYDWVVFCRLFGRMVDLPNGFPMYCRDIKQLMDQKGNPQKPEQDLNPHNALDDAKYHKKLYEWIK